jgi:hypothetical protein
MFIANGEIDVGQTEYMTTTFFIQPFPLSVYAENNPYSSTPCFLIQQYLFHQRSIPMCRSWRSGTVDAEERWIEFR